jgi:tetrahydromethanopterin S-methyltransferase subunit G
MVGHPGEPTLDPPEPGSLEERVRSLTRLIAVVAALALAGIALALVAILTDDDGGNASARRIAQIDRRVDRLERRVGNTNGQLAPADVQRMLRDKADQSELLRVEQDIAQLRASLVRVDANAKSTARAVDALNRRVDQIDQRLQNQQGGAGATQP